jgi:hypothetical protein
MAITSDDYLREAREKLMAGATPQGRLQGLEPEQVLRALFPEAGDEQIRTMLRELRRRNDSSPG